MDGLGTTALDRVHGTMNGRWQAPWRPPNPEALDPATQAIAGVDTGDYDSVLAMARRARLVLNCAGPYRRVTGAAHVYGPARCWAVL
jgi:hypothetical protein